jgi:hypothetical protein
MRTIISLEMLEKYFLIFTTLTFIFLDMRFREKDMAKIQRMKKLAQSSQGIWLGFLG